MNIINIDSQFAYREYFHNTIDLDDKETLKFSENSIEFHNRFYDWKVNPVLCLEVDDEIVCVLFYNKTKDGYLSIINLLTPKKYRKFGYARKIMEVAVQEGNECDLSRIRMNCAPSAIKFYNRLGFTYWGITRSGDYYCNMPLLKTLDDYLSYSPDISVLLGHDNQSVIDLIQRRVHPESSTGEDHNYSSLVTHLKKDIFS